MASEKKFLDFFLSKSDEALFESRLKDAVPDLVFVTDCVWEDERPPVKASLRQCRKSVVYLWSPAACSTLPFKKYDNGIIQGPTSGVVIQFVRGSGKGNVLRSGDIAIGYQADNLAIKAFVKSVWKVVRSLNSAFLCGFNPATKKKLDRNIRNFIVGPGARDLSLAGGLLKHYAVDVYYKVETPEKSRTRRNKSQS